MYHWNPWKPKFTLISGENGDTTVIEEPMTWRDAAQVAIILMIANLFIVWLPGKTVPCSEEEAIQLLWSTIIFLGQNFFSAFISLTGLALIYAKKKV